MNMDGHARSPHKTLHVRQALRVDTWHMIHPRTDQRSWWIIMYLIYYTRRSRLQKQKAAQSWEALVTATVATRNQKRLHNNEESEEGNCSLQGEWAQ